VNRPLPQLPGVEHRFVDAAGIRMHVAEAGAGDPVLLLHGWPQHWWMWRKLILPLAEHYRVLAPDLRGFGWTDAPPGRYHKHRFAADVIALVDALGIERFHLVGHDWGGIAGFELCLRHPERVRRFLALGTVHPWTPVDLRTIAATWRFWYQWVISAPFAGRLLVRGFPAFAARASSFWTVNDDAWSDEDRALFLDQFRERERAEATVSLYRSIPRHESVPAIRGSALGGRLTVPTLFLHGRGDGAISPALLRGYEPHADDMRLELIDGCGHFLPEECPETVLESALGFLARA